MFAIKDISRNACMLTGGQAECGYDWWWHSFTAKNAKTGESKPFFLEFFIVNPMLSPEKVVLGQKKEGRPSYLMVKVGTWGKNKKQLHAFYPTGEVAISKPFGIKAGDCYLSETETHGSVTVKEEDANEYTMSDSGSISWDLKIEKKIAYNVGYGTSALLRFLKGFEMYWHAQGMKTLFSGTIVLDGETYLVDKKTCYGYADKNWGSNFTTPWVWLSSNRILRQDFEEEMENSVFDIGGGKPKVFGIPFHRKLLGAYYIEGKEYEFNFSKFWHPTKTEFSFTETDEFGIWHVEQWDKKVKIVTDIRCAKRDMLFIQYETPNGEKMHKKLYNGGNGFGTLRIYRIENKKDILEETYDCYNVGCEYGEA